MTARLIGPALVLLLCAAATPVLLAQPAARETAVQNARAGHGRIQGIVFDSLTMQPVPGARVELMGSGRNASADGKGRFRFDSVPAGPQQVAFSTPQFDTLGMGILGGLVMVLPGKTALLTVSTPSLRTLWRYRCAAGSPTDTDSAIVWGTVRDAATDSLVPSAVATFSWYNLRPGRQPGLKIDEIVREVRTGAGGEYFACGLPTETVISSMAIDSSAASGPVDFAVGALRLHRLDFTVSRDMVLPKGEDMVTKDDSARAERATGSAVIRGTVMDDRKRPLANALVSIATVDTTVRTDEAGQFLLGGLPAGTHALHARRVGLAETVQIVQLRADRMNSVTVTMGSATTLATFNVRAEKSRSRNRILYDERRKRGFSYAIEGEALARSMDVRSALWGVPRLTIDQQGFGVAVRMKRVGRGECSPSAFLDGFPMDLEAASSLPPKEYRAIEVYTTPFAVPAEFVTAAGISCGVMLFWSKRAPW